MGLDISHGCWHGAYSAFMRWREEIARLSGIPLWLMENYYDAPDELIVRTRPRAHAFSRSESGGFVADRNSLTAALADTAERGDAGRWHDWAAKFLPALPLRWDALNPNPIHLLLNHSDCDGTLEAKDCGPIADSLERLMPLLPAETGGGHIGDWREKTQTFIDGLRLAAAAGEDVEFH